MKLYGWQKECLAAWEKNHYHGIANVVTGAGKTMMALYGIRRLEKELAFYGKKLRVKVVVPALPLASQWASSMKEHLPDVKNGKERPGRVGGGRKDASDRKYMIYIVNSARYCLARHVLADIKEGFCVLLIADECHRYASMENRKIFDFLSAGISVEEHYFSMGLSATPQGRGYEEVLVPALGREIFRYGFTAAAAAGNVSRFFITQIALSFTAEELAEYENLSRQLRILQKNLEKQYPYLKSLDRIHFFEQMRRIASGEMLHGERNLEEGEDGEHAEGVGTAAVRFLNLAFKRQRLTSLAAARMDGVRKLVEDLKPDSRILIFGDRISQAQEVCQMLKEQYGSKVGRYHSAMTLQERKITLERFRNGEIRILVTCRALDEGIDVPDASAGIILSGTAVNRQRIQRLGRILRKNSRKPYACMYYLYIRESSEESAFLADQEENFQISNLSYDMLEHTFRHPAYEETAAFLLEDSKKRGAGPDSMKEMRRCILEGQLRPDWLLTPGECREYRKKAPGRREKNYWLCMEKMARKRAVLHQSTT